MPSGGEPNEFEWIDALALGPQRFESGRQTATRGASSMMHSARAAASPMEITIDIDNPVPQFEQLIEQIKAAVTAAF